MSERALPPAPASVPDDGGKPGKKSAGNVRFCEHGQPQRTKSSLDTAGGIAMKSILIASDLSARSDRAFERAATLASQHQAHLVVLHVVDEEQRPSVIDHLIREARIALESDVAARMARLQAAADIEVRVEVGRDFADIIRCADDIHAEIVVLGTHRTSSLADLFRGSTAELVLRRGRLPVLLVKAPCHRPYERVLVAVDFSIFSRSAVEMAVRVAPAARIQLLHVFHVPFEAFIDNRDTRDELRQQHLNRLNAMIDEEMNRLAGMALEPMSPFERIVRQGDIRPAIQEEVARVEADLLVVGTHGRTGVGHALLGSIAEDLLRSPPCDVLAVKAW
ncbi:MAG: universal stress protein [Rhodospirillales bacterium]|nr:universal stress protein [Rhodospirillales bacterium]